MNDTQMHFVEMWAQIFAAVGTVGALMAAVVAFKHELTERRRGEVRGVRGWVQPGDTSNDDASALRRAYVYPSGHLENASQDVIFDVKYAFRPEASVGGDIRGSLEFLLPGEKQDVDCSGIPVHRTAFGLPRLELLFTDSRGIRWNRRTSGVLRVVKPFSRPWRLPHELDRSELPPWAARAHWHYRWSTTGERRSFGLPPKWWAVDVRWVRWRYARTHDKVPVPWWKPLTRWKGRHEIAERRIRQDLPLPFWIIDYRLARKHELKQREAAIAVMHKVNRSVTDPTG